MVGSRRPRHREGSHGDRNWAARQVPGCAPRYSLRPGTEPHPARQAETQAARAARASPGAVGPAPETGRGRGEAGPAPLAAARGRRGRAPSPSSPPGGRPARRLHHHLPGSSGIGPTGAPGGPRAALTVGGLQGTKTLAGGAPCAVTASFPGPTPQAAAAAATAAAVAARQLPRLRNRRRRWRQLHFRSGHHFRSGPRPAPAPAPSPHWTSGARGCLGRPRGARPKEKEAEPRGGMLRRAEGGGPGPGTRRRGAEMGAGERKEEVGEGVVEGAEEGPELG